MIVPLMRPSMPPKEDFLKIVDELWETRMLSNFSKYSQLMEKTAKDYFKSDRTFLSVVSCDVALMLLLKCFDLPAGSEVIVPSFTFNSTVNAIVWNGLKPVFADINPFSYCLSPDSVAQAITANTSAIIGVHIFGNPCYMPLLEEVAKTHKLKLLFDAAHGYGSKFNGKHICEFGDAGAYSFSGTKLITSGEGGLVYIKDPKVAERFKLARNYGFYGDYNTKMLGMNGKISEMHAAIASLAMRDIDRIMTDRQTVAYEYLERIENCEFQKVVKGDTSTYKDFSILVDDGNRDKMYNYLADKGIQTKKYFYPNHMTDYFKKDGFKLPVTEEVYSKILCIPIFNEISSEQTDYVIETINSFKS